jgi:hypothetical protein
MSLREIDASPAQVGEGGQEYFMFASRRRALRFFCERCGPETLALPECDLMFRNFLRCLPCHVFPCPTGRWLYAKTMRGVPVADDARMRELGHIWRGAVHRLADAPSFSFDATMSRFAHLIVDPGRAPHLLETVGKSLDGVLSTHAELLARQFFEPGFIKAV